MRLAMAKKMEAEMDIAMPLVVDAVPNQFEAAYASWPFRFWCVVNGVVSFKAMPREATYHISDLVDHLKKTIANAE
eukprot:m.23062 g.23062  ORF g.23062 m.23062 type:complete len:76 (+) comp5899_c0_seq1:739-966(+)